MTHGTLVQIGEICTEAGVAPWAEEGCLEVCRPVSTGTFLGPVDAPRLLLLAWVHLPRALGRFSGLSPPQRYKHWVFCSLMVKLTSLLQEDSIALPPFMKEHPLH